jgi:hypothetical protein
VHGPTRPGHANSAEAPVLIWPGTGHYGLVNDIRIANVALVVTSVLLTMAVAAGIVMFEFYCIVAVFLAGCLRGAALQSKKH